MPGRQMCRLIIHYARDFTVLLRALKASSAVDAGCTACFQGHLGERIPSRN